MKSAYIYLQLYKLFDDVTPLSVDCGRLCGSVCCKGDDSGMFLFPGEEAVYELLKPDWLTIDTTDLSYTYNGKTYYTPIAMCKGSCNRFERPLSCRIFPLTPYLNDGKLQIIIDPRAKGICRLAQAFTLDDFSPAFVKNVERTFNLLIKNKRVYAFMEEYSKYLEEFFRFFN